MAVNEMTSNLTTKTDLTRRGALLAGVTLGGLTFAPVLAPPAEAAGFRDIARSPFRKEIEWLKSVGITTGYTHDNTYRPMEPVKRDAMAAFIYRLAGSPATSYAPVFKDVPKGMIFAKEMSWMKTQGLSWGWVDGTYRPLANIKRDAMAVFLYRLLDERLRQHGVKVNVNSVAQFRDVRSNQLFSHEIRWMRAAGIAHGFSGKDYRPLANVNRQDMAAFLYRAAKLAEKAR